MQLSLLKKSLIMISVGRSTCKSPSGKNINDKHQHAYLILWCTLIECIYPYTESNVTQSNAIESNATNTNIKNIAFGYDNTIKILCWRSFNTLLSL